MFILYFGLLCLLVNGKNLNEKNILLTTDHFLRSAHINLYKPKINTRVTKKDFINLSKIVDNLSSENLTVEFGNSRRNNEPLQGYVPAIHGPKVKQRVSPSATSSGQQGEIIRRTVTSLEKLGGCLRTRECGGVMGIIMASSMATSLGLPLLLGKRRKKRSSSSRKVFNEKGPHFL